MAYQLSPWGYEIDGDLAPIVTLEEFQARTANAYTQTDKITAALAGASAVVRNACGWHVAPSMPCRATMDGGERRTFLPSMFVTNVSSVAVQGEDVTDACEWSRLGELRIHAYVPDRLRAVVCEYVAGVEAMEDLKALVTSVVQRAVGVTYGVSSETAGGVSITYGSGAVAGAGGVLLTPADVAALAPYMLRTAR